MSTSIISTHVESSVSVTQNPSRSFPEILNEPLVILPAAGIAAETLVAAAMPDHPLWAWGVVSLVSMAYIAWFWFTIACVIGLLTRLVRKSREKRILAITLLATAIAAVFAYVVSWGIYLQTGRFANYESVRFMLFNWSMLEEYMLAADRSQLVWASVFCFGTLFSIPMVGIWIYRNHRLTSCLNPAASMLASGLEVWQTEPIDDCLTESMMTPISSFGITAPANRMNVILVAVESLRPDTIGLEHQGQLVLPNISQLASQSYVWSNAYAQSTHSDYADLCLVSSLYPLRSRRHHFYHQDDPWPKQTLYDVLKPHGYSTAIISSQNEAWGCMNEFLQTENLDFFYHPQNSDAPSIIPERDTGSYLENLSGALVAGSFPDAHTADIAINWIGAQAKQNSPFYLSMNLQSSHFPYLIPDDVPAPFEPCELPPSVKFTSYAESDVPVVKNAYYNGIHECDRQVGRSIDQLKSLGIWENTIMVVTGENGEAFRENGCISHAGNPGEPTIRVASVLSAPGILGHGRDDYPFEHVDLVPTILGLMGSSTHGNFQGTNALSVDRLPLNERFLFAHVLSPIAEGDSVQYAGRWKLMTSQECAIGRLFDLQSDPTDISESHPVMRTFLTTALHQWSNRQLAYYYLPKYYTKYYPPRPPTVREICAIAGLEFEHVTSQSVATASRSD